jgi:hypothetical protein
MKIRHATSISRTYSEQNFAIQKKFGFNMLTECKDKLLKLLLSQTAGTNQPRMTFVGTFLKLTPETVQQLPNSFNAW